MTAAVKPPCIVGKFCEEHQFVHGAEAEETRAKIEKFITEMNTDSRDEITPQEVVSDLQKILDSVDARDSLAFVEVIPQLKRWVPENERKVRRRTTKEAKR